MSRHLRRHGVSTTISLLALAVALPALAQTAPAGSGQDNADTIDEVVVTGTHLSDRTVTTSPVPIDVLAGETIRTSGYQETAEILRQLAPSSSLWVTRRSCPCTLRCRRSQASTIPTTASASTGAIP